VRNLEEGEQISFSDLVKVKVYDSEGRHIGHVQDLALKKDLASPAIGHVGIHLLWTDRVGDVELVRRVEDIVMLVPWSKVTEVSDEAVRVSETHPRLTAESAGGMWLVRRDILNQQMLDAHGNRIQRVDDVLLRAEGGRLRVAGLEVSKGLLYTSSKLRAFIAGLRRKHMSRHDSDVIPWEAVQRIADGQLVIEEPVD
jgi:magnesium transporter